MKEPGLRAHQLQKLQLEHGRAHYGDPLDYVIGNAYDWETRPGRILDTPTAQWIYHRKW